MERPVTTCSEIASAPGPVPMGNSCKAQSLRQKTVHAKNPFYLQIGPEQAYKSDAETLGVQ